MKTLLIYLLLGIEATAIILLVFINLNFKNRSPEKETSSVNPTVLSSDQAVLGDIIQTVPSPTEPLTPVVPVQPNFSKKTYKIAIFGDSMVETMGENLEYLQKELYSKYPTINFDLYNYGVGGNNVDMGLNRFNSNFSRFTRNYPPISQIGADIIIVGSFSYNPFSEHDRAKHKSKLTELAHQARLTGAFVYLLVEIAPLEKDFGKGPGGVNWPEDLARIHAGKIIEQLDDSLSVTSEIGVGLIDVYSKSKDFPTKFGKRAYVNNHDGIHPSILGHQFTAKIIASLIKLH